MSVALAILTRAGRCQRHGPFTDRAIRFGRGDSARILRWCGCPKCADEQDDVQAQSDAARRQQELQAALQARMRNAGIPQRFVGQGFDSYRAHTPAQAEVKAVLEGFVAHYPQHARAGTMLVLSGPPGTGKSHLACAVAQALMPTQGVLYTHAIDLIRTVRESWRSESARSERDVIEDFANVDLLIIDEVGVQYRTEAERLLMFDIIDRRYRMRRPLLMLTNLNSPQLQTLLGERSYDRLRETGRWLCFDWDSYRKRRRPQGAAAQTDAAGAAGAESAASGVSPASRPAQHARATRAQQAATHANAGMPHTSMPHIGMPHPSTATKDTPCTPHTAAA